MLSIVYFGFVVHDWLPYNVEDVKSSKWWQWRHLVETMAPLKFKIFAIYLFIDIL